MNITDLYKRLESIFVDHTTHQWKNGWQHEGDRLSKELTIQNDVPWNNLFLLQKTKRYSYGNGLSLDGPNGFKIELQMVNSDRIRIDIEVEQTIRIKSGLDQIGKIDIFYYVDNELDWLDQQDFIVDLCQNVYDASVMFRESFSVIPSGIYGDNNPKFAQSFRRERQLNELGI
jgi:hypothetical protein